MEPNIALVLGCLGIAQALFLIVYLLTLKTGNRKANILLGVVLLGLTIRIGKAVIYNYTYVAPWPRNLGISGFLLAGPFLWFYGKALLEKANDFPATNYLHLIPFVLFLLFSPIIPNNGDLVSLVLYALVQLHLAVYLGFAWWLLYRSKQHDRNRLAPWYRNIAIGVTLIWILYAGIFVGLVPFYLLGATSFSFLIYLFSFLFLKKHHFVLEKYATSSVGLAESKKLVQQVRHLFDTEETYLNHRTSLNLIAEKLAVKPRLLSQAINESEQVNFSEFVNQYRIEQAKRLLVDPARKQDKIATIAFDSGFGNLTSFNVAFKARVKMTPSQYRRQFATA